MPASSRHGEYPKAGGEHRVSVAAALTSLDVKQHSLAVDRGNLQAHHLSDEQTRRISARQRDTIARPFNCLQEACDFFIVENRGKFLRILASDDPLKRLLLAQGIAVEEAQRARDLIDMRPGILLDAAGRRGHLPCQVGPVGG